MPDPFSIEPPRWLQEIAHPIDPGATGEALSSMLGGFYNMATGTPGSEAFAAARESMRDPMYQFTMDSAKAKAQGQILDLAQKRQMVDYGNNVRAGQVEFANALSEISKSGSWNDPAARSKIFDVGARNPTLMDSPVWKQTMDNFSKADVAKTNANKWQTQAELAAKKLDDEEKFGVERDKINDQRLQLAKDKAEAGSPAMQTVNQIMDLKKQAADAQKAGDNDTFNTLTEKASLLTATLPGSGDTETFQGYKDDGSPSFMVTRGKGGTGATGTGATVATESRAQVQMAQYENVMPLITDLQKNLRGMDVGVAGVLGSAIGDKALPQMGVNKFFDEQRVKNQVDLGTAKESLMRKMQDDPMRFTKQDAQDVGKLFPTLGPNESIQDAQAKLSQVKHIIINRMRTWSQVSGEPLEGWAKPKDQIRSDYSKQAAAFEQAIQKNPAAAEQLKVRKKAAYDQAVKDLANAED
jgi:hypothetical protein